MRVLGWLIITFILISCSPRYIEVPRVTLQEVNTRDTIINFDSIYTKEQVFERDGTLYNITTNEKYVNRYIYKYKDSIRVDSIPVVVEVEKEKVVYKQNTAQKILAWSGIIAWVILTIKIIKKYGSRN